MDLTNKNIMELKIEQGKHGERLKDLEEYQAKQNGCIQRLESRVEKIYQMVIGLLGGVVASLVLLVINLAVSA